MNLYSDDELLQLFQNSSDKSRVFNLVVDKYKERLYWHIRKILIIHEDTDDALQNCFIKAWHNLENFRGDSKIYTWLYRIATNEALTMLNNKRKQLSNSIDDVETNLINSIESADYFDGDEIQKKLQKAILQLPQKQRIVFNMKYFDNIKYDDMANILTTSVGALKATYHHAVKKIELFMQAEEID